jgi:hypothetical protein
MIDGEDAGERATQLTDFPSYKEQNIKTDAPESVRKSNA